MLSVLKSIGAAIVAAFKAIGHVALAPVRAVASIFGGGVPAVPELPEIDTSPIQKPTLPGPSLEQAWDDIAAMFQEWAVDSLIADRLLPLPSALPRDVKEFGKGLTREECGIIAGSSRTAAISHLRGLFKLLDVRKIQSLTPEPWASAPASHDRELDVDASPFMPLRASPA